MKDKIISICKKLEKDKNIKILFAVENGSRAWRMESKDSDYDVRFVFVRPISEYISLNKPVDVINVAYDKDCNECNVEGSIIDMSGFGIFKFASMVYISNPTVIEWLISDIVYYGEQNKVFKKFAIEHFSKKTLYYHYKSLCKQNYLKYLKSGDLVTYKKYLYAYRGLINAKWVAHKKTVPPIIFDSAINGLADIIPVGIIKKLNEIIKLKSEGKEKDIIQNIVSMDNYIENFLKNVEEEPKEEAREDVEILNKELRRIILGK